MIHYRNYAIENHHLREKAVKIEQDYNNDDVAFEKVLKLIREGRIREATVKFKTFPGVDERRVLKYTLEAIDDDGHINNALGLT